MGDIILDYIGKHGPTRIFVLCSELDINIKSISNILVVLLREEKIEMSRDSIISLKE